MGAETKGRLLAFQCLPIPDDAGDVPGVLALALSYADQFGWEAHSFCVTQAQAARLGDGPDVERREAGVFFRGVLVNVSNGDPPYLFMLGTGRASGDTMRGGDTMGGGDTMNREPLDPREAITQAARLDLSACLLTVEVKYGLTASEMLAALNEAMGRLLTAAVMAEREEGARSEWGDPRDSPRLGWGD